MHYCNFLLMLFNDGSYLIMRASMKPHLPMNHQWVEEDGSVENYIEIVAPFHYVDAYKAMWFDKNKGRFWVTDLKLHNELDKEAILAWVDSHKVKLLLA